PPCSCFSRPSQRSNPSSVVAIHKEKTDSRVPLPVCKPGRVGLRELQKTPPGIKAAVRIPAGCPTRGTADRLGKTAGAGGGMSAIADHGREYVADRRVLCAEAARDSGFTGNRGAKDRRVFDSARADGAGRARCHNAALT